MFIVNKWIVTLLCICLTGGATSLPLSLMAQRQFEQVLEASANDSAKQQAALKYFASVAGNLKDRSADASLASFGISVEPSSSPVFEDLTVRSEAYAAIGRLATPASIEFLHTATLGQSSPEELEVLGPAIHIALRNARRLQLPDLRDQWKYLSSLLMEDVESPFHGRLLRWATNQLCNLGALEHLPEVSIAFNKLSSVNAAEDTQFCQDRMWVVASHSDRPTALASVLTVPNAVNNPRLVNWAILELKTDRHVSSAQRVDAYIKELIAIPRSSPMRKAALYNVVAYYIPPTENPGIY